MRLLRLLIVVGLLLTLLFLPIPFKLFPIYLRSLMDGCHIFLFAGLTALIYYYCPTLNLVRLALYALIIAVLSELIQPYFKRSLELHDFVFNILGIGLTIFAIYLKRRPAQGRVLKYIFYTFLLISGFCFCLPVFQSLQAYQRMHQRFPVLADFESNIDQQLWVPGPVADGRLACTLDLPGSLWCQNVAGRSPGIAFAPGLMDWSEYNNLVLEIENPGEAFTIYLRIDDDQDCTKYTERFNASYLLKTGSNQIKIAFPEIIAGPTHRKLNLAKITRIVLSLYADPKRREFKIEEIRLE